MPSAREIRAQPRQRTLVQEAGEIVRAVGQQLAAPEADEEIEDTRARRARRWSRLAASRERGMRDAERARVAAQACRGARAARRPARAPAAPTSSAYSCARAASTSSTLGGAGVLRRRDRAAEPRGRRRSPPRPTSTRSAGMRAQFETDGCEMPIWRASAPTPPAARIASSRPGSRIGRFLLVSSYCNSIMQQGTAGTQSRSIAEAMSALITEAKRVRVGA